MGDLIKEKKKEGVGTVSNKRKKKANQNKSNQTITLRIYSQILFRSVHNTIDDWGNQRDNDEKRHRQGLYQGKSFVWWGMCHPVTSAIA